MPVFKPSVTSPVDARGAAWLYFRGDEVLVDDAGALHASPDALALAPTRTLYLGTFDDRPCFAAEIDRAFDAARFVSLRAALMMLGEGGFGLLSAAAALLHFEKTHVRCSCCGGALVAQTKDRARRCAVCAVDYYPRIAPAVIVLVHDGPRVLLTHVGTRPFWALVAGFLEPGETFEECAAREVREETGVAIDQVRYFGSQPWPFPSQVMIGFHARFAGGEVVVDKHELDEAKWFSIDALPPLPPPISIARRLLDSWMADVKR